MCKTYCDMPTEDGMTCEGCKGGIKGTIDNLLVPATIDSIVSGFVNSDFCTNIEMLDCKGALEWTIRGGLPLLVNSWSGTNFGDTCNVAFPGTCTARKFAKLF
jgi:hypothetical protein